MKVNYGEAIAAIEAAEKIGIITHLLGDGDAFGSLLGLRNILEDLGKEVVIFSNEAELGDQVKFMAEYARYNPTDHYEPVDLLIMTDVSNKSRLTMPEVFESAKENEVRTMVIDHHAEGEIYQKADVVIRETEISSASELIFWMSQEMGMRLNRETAEFLLVGIETDTNFLQNPNTVNNTTYKAKAELLKYGARVRHLVEKLSSGKDLTELNFMGAIVKKAKFNKRTGILSATITAEDQKKYGIEPGASSQISSFLDQTKGAAFVFVAEQREPNVIKVSMRSNSSSINVAKLAAFFGGGGHVKAAGFNVEGNLSDLLK